MIQCGHLRTFGDCERSMWASIRRRSRGERAGVGNVSIWTPTGRVDCGDTGALFQCGHLRGVVSAVTLEQCFNVVTCEAL